MARTIFGREDSRPRRQRGQNRWGQPNIGHLPATGHTKAWNIIKLNEWSSICNMYVSYTFWIIHNFIWICFYRYKIVSCGCYCLSTNYAHPTMLNFASNLLNLFASLFICHWFPWFLGCIFLSQFHSPILFNIFLITWIVVVVVFFYQLCPLLYS